MTNNTYKQNHADTMRALDLERRYRLLMERENVPARLHAGLIRYFVYRIMPSVFLSSALASDQGQMLAGGMDQMPYMMTGDDLKHIATFFARCAPPTSFGTYAAVSAWCGADAPTPDPCGEVA